MLCNRVVSPVLGFVLSVLLVPAPARAEDTTVYMTEALDNVARGVLNINDFRSFGYDDHISLLGACVATGRSVTFSRQLWADETYGFVGDGDRDVIDVDVDIFDPNGNLVASDRRPDTLAAVMYTPRRNGRYTISLKLDRARERWSFCALAILRRGGWTVPPVNLVNAASRCINKCQVFAHARNGLRFVDQPNQWTFFGGVLNEGESLAMRNMHFGLGPHIFFAAGDDHARDIDLRLTEPGSRLMLGPDNGPAPQPIFRCQTEQGADYELELRNERSGGPSLMFAVALAD